ncbi:MAG TPA: magnesium transporter CorA family protein [Saprospiraceae bacterium]|nr:magnesium transporter CorA family protein [Saprospiraceae bacterium]
MIRYYLGSAQSLREVKTLFEASWIHVSSPFEPGELEQFANQLGIEIDFLSDPLDPEERARYEKYDEARSIILHTPVINDAEKENDPIFITVPLGIVLCQNKIVTICAEESPVMSKFLEGRIKRVNTMDERVFILQIFEQNVLLFLEYLKKLNLKRGLIEQELYHSSRSQELKSLLRIEKSLVYFVNSLSANELLKIKMKRTDFLGTKDHVDYDELFEDIIVDSNQAREVAQLYTNILNGTMEAYASIISNNLNIFINRLTVITILLMVPTLIASFFGMNVPMPLNMGNSSASFYLIILFTAGTGLLLAWILKRKKIL